MNINKVIVVGYVTRSPEMRFANNNARAVATFGIATNRTWTNQAGEQQEEVEFHNCVAFDRTAEIAGEYLKKGALAGVEGRLQTSKYERDGNTFYRTQIIVEQLRLGPKSYQIEHDDESAGGTRTTPRNHDAPIQDDDDAPF